MLDLLGSLAGADQSSLMSFASELIGTFLPNSGLGLPATGRLPVGSPAGTGTISFNSTFVLFAVRALICGYVLNWIRLLFSALTTKIHRLLFPTAYIAHHEPAYRWVQAWMASEPSIQRQLDHFTLQTRESRKARGNDKNVIRRRDDDDFNEQSATWESGLILGRILPLPEQVLRIKYRGYWLWVSNEVGNGPLGGNNMVISTLGYQKHALRSFLAATHAAFYAKEELELLIFHSESGDYSEWMDPICRPARPWSSVILPLKEVILRDMQRFLSDKETRWYAARGIPHRRGYLFHGDPGAGKTTLVSGLASKLRLDIYVISICQSGMDDNKLGELFRNCKPHSIILLEDIDRIFSDNNSVRTGSASTAAQTASDGSSSPFVFAPAKDVQEETGISIQADANMSRKSKKESSVVTMSGLLNAIDGVSSQEGCILIASTNHLDKLDPALTRAGRFDVRVPFHSATPDQARNLFLHFFPVEDFTRDRSADQDLDLLIADVKDLALFGSDPAPVLSKTELEALASDFAAALFPKGADGGAGGVEGTRLAMASMQAFLLNFKESPLEAVNLVSTPDSIVRLLQDR